MGIGYIEVIQQYSSVGQSRVYPITKIRENNQ